MDLRTSQSTLIQLSLDLQNPAKSSDVHVDICKTSGYYAAVAKFIDAA